MTEFELCIASIQTSMPITVALVPGATIPGLNHASKVWQPKSQQLSLWPLLMVTLAMEVPVEAEVILRSDESE